jgi:hypothetical protein
MAMERRAAATFHDAVRAEAVERDEDEAAGESLAPRSSCELALHSEFLSMLRSGSWVSQKMRKVWEVQEAKRRTT